MVTKEVLQKFIDAHVSEIGEICSGGLKDKSGKWLLVCPIMERFELDFSKVDAKTPVEEVVETKEAVEAVEEKPAKKAKKSKKK